MTCLTADRGALTNDDRLDALARACQHSVDAMAQDVEVHMGVRRDEMMVAELYRLKAGAYLGLGVITGHQSQKTIYLRWLAI